MSNASLIYNNGALQSSTPRVLRLRWEITGAKTVKSQIPGLPVLTTFDALSTQSQIDDHLGTEDEFLLAAFDSTAMGADMFAGIVDMGGQAAKVINMTARCYSASNTLVTRQCLVTAAGLTASTAETELAKGTDGNIAFRVAFGNTPDMDGLTAGSIEVDIEWLPK